MTQRWCLGIGLSIPCYVDASSFGKSALQLSNCSSVSGNCRQALVSELLTAKQLELFAAGLAEVAKDVDGVAIGHLS